jgi:membrane protease YdiL (CAAX protease family)
MATLTLSMLDAATFGFLGLSIISLWLPRFWWLAPFALSVGFGYLSGTLYGPAIIWIVLLASLCLLFRNTQRWYRFMAAIGIAAISLALGLHVLPGFHNPQVAHAIRLSANAVPYDLYLNFDKATAGLCFLGIAYVGLIRTWRECREALARAAPIIGLNIAIIIVLSLALGYLRFDPKRTSFFWLWAYHNLFLTCLAEEAFFRGLIQGGLRTAFNDYRYGALLALIIGAALFGVAHFAGGWQYVLLATVAGLGYGWVFMRTGRIEMSILAHFLMNATHFLLFTYPRVA